MDSSNRNYSVPISEDALIQDIKEIIICEYQRTNKLWILFSEITEIFNQKAVFSLEYRLTYYGYKHNWKNFFVRGRIFSIYPSQSYTDFYVSLLSLFVTNSFDTRRQKTTSKTKQPCKADSRLIKSLNDEVTVEISNVQSQTPTPNLPLSIESIELLEEALIMIITILVKQNPQNYTNTMELSSYFTKKYNQSLKSLMREFLPDMKLIEFIQTSPKLRTQQLNGDWQISISKKLF